MAGYRFNPHGNGLIMADEIHARVHLGQLFSASYIDTNFANAEVVNIIFEAGRVSHVRFRADASVNTLIQTYSDPAYSGGTPVTPANHNRLSSNVSANVLRNAVTVSDPGAFIEDWLALGGAGGGRGAGLTDTGDEWIVPAGNFLLRATNLTTNAGVLHVHFSWYEPGA